MKMRRLFIVNPQSGRGRGLRVGKEIEESINNEEIEGEIIYTKKPGEERILARKAILDGYDCLYSVGGEGTNNGVINGLAELGIPIRIPLGFFPAGTANDFARYLGIPEDVKEALEMIKENKVMAIDLGKVSGKINERIFLNEVSFGFTSRIVQVFEDAKRRYPFFPTIGLYLATAFPLFFQLKYFEVEIAIPEANIRDIITFVLIANGPNCGGILKFKLAPEADPADNLLDICLIKKMGIARVLIDTLRAIGEGTHLNLPEIWTKDGKLPQTYSLTISSPKDLPGETDGELLVAEKEYRVTVLPKALKVIVPNK